jgi:hypothetical protein
LVSYSSTFKTKRVALAFSSSFVLVPAISASSNLSGQGVFSVTSATNSDCTPVLGTDLTTCTQRFVGVIYGTISGPFTSVQTVMFSPTTGTTTGGPLTFSGTLACNPCVVVGLTGSLTFSSSFSVFQTKAAFTAPISITGGSGGLAGISGSGTLLVTRGGCLLRMIDTG